MARIKRLSHELITHIAAGEVIDRPVAVVKELVENALDAQATMIVIALEEGGSRKISVIDNGHGMDEEDLKMSYQPHTTSKLSSLEELEQLSSLGFRGEALSSIAAVSRLTLKSRKREHLTGTGLKIDFGHLQAMSAVGMSAGTHVIVEDLFLNMPARRQFLKAPAAEVRTIIRLITHCALAYPLVGFSVSHNGVMLLDIPSQQSQHERVVAVLGQDSAQSLVPLQHDEENMQITGFIGKPQQARASAVHQYLIINNRVVRDAALNQVIKNAYGTALPPRLQPVFVMNIQVPPAYVDANIHPRKEEVDIQSEAELHAVLSRRIKEILQEQDLTYQYQVNDAGADPVLSGMLRDVVDPWDVRRVEFDVNSDIAQVHKLYLVIQTKQGMLIIDQHAAHERILYEQFKAGFEEASQTDKPFILPEPQLFNISLADIPLLEEHRGTFTALGFDIESFGQATYKITAVPELFKSHDSIKLVLSVLDDLRNNVGVINLEKAAHKTLAYLACRTAIKAGDTLSPHERRELITKLNQTPGQYTCPHGRPVQVEIDLDHLHRMFERK